MSNFKVFFLLAMKRFFCRRNLIIMFLIFSMSMYFVLTGINNYKNSKTNSIDFQKIESLKFERIRNYTHYSFHGVNVMFLSSPAGIFLYNPGSVADWSAKIDSVTGLEISRNLKGKGLFSEELPSLFHFPGLILYLVTLIVLFWGFETLRDKECIKFLSILSSYRNVFFYMILPGVILLSVTLLLLFSSLLGIVTLYGIPLSGSELSGLFKYYLATLSMLLVFYFSGAFIGARGSKSSGILPLISFWLIVVFLIPGAVTYWTAKQAEKITSNYHLELTKLDIVNNFENKAEKKAGKFDRNNIEAAREIAKEY
ncbi:MAG: hypothetical protein GY757_09655, partial [bacterium]|nr:hypothetical protein [bacterium]